MSSIHTVVIGAGQAGLCASFYLSKKNIDHVVLERARVGERWRSERWDSLRFQFPNRYLHLPGFPYDGDEPEAFMDRDGVVDVIDRYAEHINAPVRCGVNVQSIEHTSSGLFEVKTSTQTLLAQNVILATGPYQKTLIPNVSEELPRRIRQLPASAFTNADALPKGGVLVVGAGGSGVQITEDLLAAGREVWLCVGNFKRIPRRYGGRDIMDWFEELKLSSQVVVERDPSDHSPLLTGVDGGYEVDLRRVVAEGGTLLGRLEGVDADNILLGDQLLNHMQAAEEAYDNMITGIKAALSASSESAIENEPKPEPPGPMPPEPPTRLNLRDANINSVIWSTGYGVDFNWVKCGDYLADGYPVQERGIGTVPGLYYLGLFMMHTPRSSFFWGVGDDAEYVVSHLSERET